MRRIRPYLPYLFLLGLGIWVLDQSFGRVIHYANDYFFGDTEDAYKNYFAAAYYLKYDQGTHFSGMNYPYGEHVIYTDNQPLITWILKFVEVHLFPVSDRVPAIFNWLMIFSLLGCMWWMFLILRRCKLPDWYAIPVAILISALSPQIHRIVGHYALSYAFLIPMWWYLLLQHEDTKYKWLNLLLIIGSITLAGFLHAYHLLIGSMFAFAFLGLRSRHFWKTNKSRFAKELGIAVLVFVIPVICFQAFVSLTDPFEGRPSFPYGFFKYRATLASIFLPVMGPFWEAWNRFVERPMEEIEAFSYVGLVASCVGVLSLIRIGKLAWRKKYRRIISPVMPKGMGNSLLAASLVLCFAMGIPFIWGLEFLPEYLGPLKQFRSLGRFAWVFYYVFTTYAAWYVYLIFRRVRQKGLQPFAYGILAVALCFWGWEAAIHLQAHTSAIKAHRNSNALKHDRTNYLTALDSAGVSIDDFQAILPIPAFQIGSDKFVPRFVTKTILGRSFKLSYDTGLPLLTGAMARTPLSHTKKLIQVLSNKHISKEILEDLPNQKPILILKQNKAPITMSQQRVVHRANLLFQDKGYSFYQMDLDQLEADTDFTKARYRALQRIDTLRWNEFLVQPAIDWMHFDGFDQKHESSFGEEFAYAEEGPFSIYSGSIPANELFHVSIWLRIDPDIAGFPVLYFKEFDQHGTEVQKKEYPSMFGNEIFKDWQLIDGTFKTKDDNHRVELVLEGKKIAVESLLIRPHRTDVFLPQEGEHELMFNNYYLE